MNNLELNLNKTRELKIVKIHGKKYQVMLQQFTEGEKKIHSDEGKDGKIMYLNCAECYIDFGDKIKIDNEEYELCGIEEFGSSNIDGYGRFRIKKSEKNRG